VSRHRGSHGLRARAGRLAVTSRVGKSTFGKSLTGSARYRHHAEQRDGRHQQLVAIGRRMNVSEKFMTA